MLYYIYVIIDIYLCTFKAMQLLSRHTTSPGFTQSLFYTIYININISITIIISINNININININISIIINKKNINISNT